ncbi:MAG: GntR family transcriptional regulator, partial [Actinobacteria bacterium]|nr:GntR family transcriptional regulator [Actinomycetota bacterium]
MAKILSETQCKLMEALAEMSEPIEVRTLAEKMGMNQSPVAAAAVELAQEKWLQIDEQSYQEYALGNKAQW